MKRLMRRAVPKSRFKIQEFTNPRTGSLSWRIAGIKRDGTRIRENFADAEEARNRQIELEAEFVKRDHESALRTTRLSEEQIAIAEACFKLVEEDNQVLTAVRFWQEHGKLQVPSESPRLADAFEQFKTAIQSDSSLRELTKTATRLRAAAFVNATTNIRVSAVTPELVEKFLDGIPQPRTRVNYKFGISRFFSWCAERPRRWVMANPCAVIRVKMGDAAPPVILSVADCKERRAGRERNCGRHDDGRSPS